LEGIFYTLKDYSIPLRNAALLLLSGLKQFITIKNSLFIRGEKDFLFMHTRQQMAEDMNKNHILMFILYL